MRIDRSKAIETTFIDLNYAADLRTNLAQYSNYYGEPNIVDGKYEEKILPFESFVIAAQLIPAAACRSFFFISLSISNFHNFL